jgi:hypothetical protein
VLIYQLRRLEKDTPRRPSTRRYVTTSGVVGDTAVVLTSTCAELRRAARDADGRLGPERIADILDTDELAVAVSTTIEISVDDD